MYCTSLRLCAGSLENHNQSCNSQSKHCTLYMVHHALSVNAPPPQILPYINGFHHVAKIASLSEVHVSLVKECVQHLV